MPREHYTQAVFALRERRAEIAGDIERLENNLRKKKLQFAAIHETIQLLDPEPKSVRVRAISTQTRIFQPGEIVRAIFAVLRAAGKPLTAGAIREGVLAHLDIPATAKGALGHRVHGSLYYLKRSRQVLRKIGEGRYSTYDISPDVDPAEFEAAALGSPGGNSLTLP